MEEEKVELNSRVYKSTVNLRNTFGKINDRWYQRFTYPDSKTLTIMLIDYWDKKAIVLLEVTEIIYNLLDFKQNDNNTK